MHGGMPVGGGDVGQAGGEAADELVGQRGERTLVGYTAFHALRDRFPALDFLFLSIAVGRAFFHGGRGAHTAIGLEGAALIQNGFAGSFFGAGEQAANHRARSAGSDGLGDVARKFNSAVGDDRHASAFRGARGFHDGGDLRNAGAGDAARGADRAGSHSNFQSINAERNEILRAFVGGYVAGDELHVRQAMADGFDDVHDAGGMAVRRVDGNDVGLALRHFHGALQKIAGGADGRADAQPALLVLRGATIFAFLLNVFDGD